MMRSLGVTFANLADPVIVDLTVPIVPVSSVVKLNFSTVLIVIVVVWFSKAPVLIAKLFWEINTIRQRFRFFL